MTKFEKVMGIICIILIAFIIAAFAYAVGQAAYEYAYSKGMKNAYTTMRVTTIQDQGTSYVVVVKDLNDNVYIHNVNK